MRMTCFAADVKKIRESKSGGSCGQGSGTFGNSDKSGCRFGERKEEEFNEDRERSGRAEPENRKGRGSDPCKKELEKSGADDSREDTNAGRTGNGTEERTGKSAGKRAVTEEIGKRQEKLAEYDELKKLQKQIKELEKQIEILKGRESRYQEKKAQMQAQLEQKRNLLEQLKDAEIKVLKVTAEQKEVSVRKETAEDILIQYKRYQRQKKSVEEAQKSIPCHAGGMYRAKDTACLDGEGISG